MKLILLGLLTSSFFVSCQNLKTPIEATLDYEKKLRKKNGGNWKPIRILNDYTNMAQSLRADQVALVVDSATQLIEQFFSVYPKKIIDEVKDQQMCRETEIKAYHQTEGIKDYDLVIYYGIVEFPGKVQRLSKGKSQLTKSNFCFQDQLTNRVVAGEILFNSFLLDQIDQSQPTDEDWEWWVSSTVSEMTRLMGFHYDLLDDFRNPTTNQKLGKTAVVQEWLGKKWVVHPLVVQQVQAHYGCSKTKGAPLEDIIDVMAWEKVAFGNEIMTYQREEKSIYSNFTLKFMESTGWYYVDYKYSQQFIWGKGQGCSTSKGGCPDVTDDFCENNKNTQCSIDYLGIGSCKGDYLSGGCTYWTNLEGGSCQKESDFKSQVEKIGGYQGAQSRCWVNTLPSKFGYPATTQAGCFKSYCVKNGIQFTVGSKTFTCKPNDKTVAVSYQGKKGTFVCPNYERFCANEDRKCVDGCNGRGNCVGSNCQCWAGFKGAACQSQWTKER